MATTFKAAVNRVLAMKRLLPINDDATFNDDTMLSSDQVALKQFFDIANRLAVMRMNERYLEREFTLTLAQGVTTYPLDTSISAEGLTYHSFYNTNADGSARPLRAWNGGYDAFRSAYPDLTKISQGQPQSWILQPVSSAAGDVTHNVIFYPTPDKTYNIIYRGKLNPIPLTVATDTLQFPVEYEHTLFLYAKALLESELGSGGDDLTYELAGKAVEAVKAWSKGPLEARPIQRVAVRMRMPGQRGRFDFDGRAGWRR